MEPVRNQRDIIDRKALTAQFAALEDDHAPDSSELRNAALDLLKQALADGRAEIRRRLVEQGESGDVAARAMSFLVDQVIRLLHDHTVGCVYPVTNPTAGERLSVVAVGGYGRGEMAPYSDVDLLFLHPYKQTPWSESVVEHMLYLLWDTGLKVGHATRSVDDCMRLAKSDITIRTALLEARYIWGDQELFQELKARYRKEVVAKGGPEFLEQKLAERDERHQRYGDSRYVVEPNLKEGKGGLRDMHTLYWIAKFLYQVEDVSELVERGVLTAEEHRRFVKAHRFLWTVRCHLHDLTGRPEERLTFDVQPELALRLNYTDRAGARGIERFMKHYFLTAKDVGDLTRIICTALEEQHRRKPRLRLPRIGLRGREIDGFRAEGGRLDVLHDDDFAKEPVKMLRLFHVAQKKDLDIHPNALRLIRPNLGKINRKLRADPEANRLFLDILTSKKNPETTLRRMNEAGVLGRFITDFGRVVAQTQHDMYHHYTVDEHTIRAIGILWRIEQGMLAEDHPLSNEIIHKVLSRRVLYLAVFLHDIAKGRGGDHSELGAAVAEKLGPRLGLEPAETETVAWLVLYHLAMSSTAFKRDLGDPKTIEDFVALVQSPERLRLLIVLTVVDIRAVGPGVWNGWKGQLLRELYYRAEEAMSGGLITEGREARAAEAKRQLRAALTDWSEKEIDAHFMRGYDAYWLSADTETHARHARIMREADRNERPLTIETRVDRFQAVTEVTVYTADHPGLFGRIAGAMAISGASIVDAKIFTTTDGMALDTFFIQDMEGNAFAQSGKLAKLSSAIEQTLSGSLRPQQRLSDQTSSYPLRTRIFTVEPVVLIDNNASNSWTVIEVNGRDRPGLLHDLTWTLFRLSLSIGSARIATYGERAVDVFYVRDMFGLKVTHAGKLKKIERELRDALMTPEQRAAAKKKAEAAKKKAEADKADGKPVAAARKRKPKPKAKAPTA
ncbi:MAG: [protein-PII] uridylyltransferase [Minwuiales bacterium]|nr:[protein-PII] uridylyltransferase [Minwuiales bacterium]